MKTQTVNGRLSPKTVKVLGLIADGHSYAQIVDGNEDVSYLDIFAAAEEALRLNEQPSDYESRLAEIRSRYPRAYERWTAEEDARLVELAMRSSNSTIANELQRQPSAIASRLDKLIPSRATGYLEE